MGPVESQFDKGVVANELNQPLLLKRMIEEYRKAHTISQLGHIKDKGSLLEFELQGIEGIVWDQNVLQEKISQLKAELETQGCKFDADGNLIESQ